MTELAGLYLNWLVVLTSPPLARPLGVKSQQFDHYVFTILCVCSFLIVIYILVFLLGMTRDDLFNTNASIVKNLAEACTRYFANSAYAIFYLDYQELPQGYGISHH